MAKPADYGVGSAALRRLHAVSPQPFAGAVYRVIGSRWLSAPLTSAGSLLHGGRFNPPAAFEVLYTALAADTALAEREGILLTATGIKLAPTIRTGILLRIECRLSAVLDVTDEPVRRAVQVTLADLLGPWLPWNVAETDAPHCSAAPSQRLGAAVYASRRFEGILAPSGKDPSGRCLAIFPERLHTGSSLTIDDPTGVIAGALGIAAAGRRRKP